LDKKEGKMGIIKRNEQIYAEYRAGGVTLRELATNTASSFNASGSGVWV